MLCLHVLLLLGETGLIPRSVSSATPTPNQVMAAPIHSLVGMIAGFGDVSVVILIGTVTGGCWGMCLESSIRRGGSGNKSIYIYIIYKLLVRRI